MRFPIILVIVSFLLFFGLVIDLHAWEKNPDSLEDYAIYVSQREGAPVGEVIKILHCESSFNHLAHNKTDPHGGAKGVAQFLEPTFYGFAKQYQIDTPDIWNPYQQINLMIYMVRDGFSSHWVCARMA